MDRRQFLKLMIAVGASGAFLDSYDVLIRRALSAPRYFDLHPFIKAHPEAVFIKRTNVGSKMDSEAKKKEGIDLVNDIFTISDVNGIPTSNKIAIKPNITCASGRSSTEEGMGIVTDPYFSEGMIERMIGMGLLADNIYVREGNWIGDAYCPGEYNTSPYKNIAERLGIHADDFPTGRKITQLTLNTLKEGSEVIWKDCPDGVVFRRIGYVAPFNDKDSWLLDIAKFKTHGMGMTLCSKNLQGICVAPYIHFCAGINQKIINDFQPDAEKRVEELYLQHLANGVPRWDRPGRDWNSGYGMEMWAQRTCDSLSVTNVGFCIIEGIYGRNGNAFFEGPGIGGKAEDFMTNILIFGKNSIKVDIIGHWLGGHEPGNFGLFHIAKERGLTDVLNPRSIPLYLWENGLPQQIRIDDIERFPLLTYYLQRNYNGQNEPKYHLVDEPFDYGSSAVEIFAENKAKDSKLKKPDAEIIGQNFPNPFNGLTNIEYRVPRDGFATLEIYDSSGQRIDILVNRWHKQGTYLASWDPGNRVSGIYFYVFRLDDGFRKIGKMILVK